MPLRSFGSVSKAEVIKEVYGDVVAATDWRLGPIGATWGALLNGGVDDATIQFKVPSTFVAANGYLYIICLGVANTPNMGLAVTLACGQNGQLPNVRGQNVVLFPFATVANTLLILDFGLNPAVLLPNDFVTVWVQMDAATNIYVLGAYLTW